MVNALQEALGMTESKAAPSVASEPSGKAVFAAAVNMLPPAEAADLLMGMIEGVELEAVFTGALMRLKFGERTNPAAILPALKAIDPAVKVREDFPAKGTFGKRETSLARVLVINLDASRDAVFIDMVCQNGDDLKVSVSKKAVADFIPGLEKLGKLSEKNLAKLKAAIEGRKSVTTILGEAEQFGVAFWKTEDGKAFMEALQAEPPAPHVEAA